jgi:SAM-dependent methyltransferase
MKNPSKIRARFLQVLTQLRMNLILRLLPTLEANEAKKVMLTLLGERQAEKGGHVDIDAVVNFAAYQRDDWVKSKAMALAPGALVLDAGAGQGRYRRLFDHTQYKAQDFAQYEGSEKGPLIETWQYGKLDYVCDITDIPVADASFNMVLCTEVLEHVPDPIATLHELVRVLAPGGSLVLTVPLGSGVHQEPYHFFGGFSPYFFRHHLSALGLEINEIKPLGGLLKHVGQELGRVGRTLSNDENLNCTVKHLIDEWLPVKLFELDEKYFVEQFTVGYLVEARKPSVSA